MTRARVAALYRYPVKSMLGERLTEAEVSERGLAGDRRFALLDEETGKVASAKNPRLWRALLTCRATLTEAGPRITGPDGTEVHAVSEIVGRPVTLTDTPPPDATLDRSRPEEVLRAGVDAQVEADVVRFGSAAPVGTFFDFAPVHLITTSTLAGIAEVQRYRPNLVLDTGDTEGFVEHDWVGGELRIGDRLVLRVMASTPRCAVPTLAHGDLSRDPEALRVLARHHRVPALPGRTPEPCAGVYAQVLRGGWVREGDVYTVSSAR
ncbi:MOSC domain-containing protein [Streptomyces fulvoviolaceus]|uniref:MOSC domain-containing protein n=1 Tax=Streptomyces fulvoviolaceus TaxID=285535 RepID=UPI0021C0EC3D|nr:MOSC N-terminal beta barrel domain-containing protein [Streptomyces fulvoviolaceus]MCT9076490.1 MOSC N-terminal beta barrel domain-containing protein [Streptomyces fulvoviolaceus]